MLDSAQSRQFGTDSPWGKLVTRNGKRLKIWSELMAEAAPEDPAWYTENTRIELGDSIALRRFGDSEGHPVLVVTPQVNHSYIADFAQGQSLVETLMESGLTNVAVTDWLPPPKRPYAIADSLDDLRRCLEEVGGRAHVIGLCQGGWQATILAALEPERFSSLTLAAAPIDTQVGTTVLHLFTYGMPMMWYRNFVAMGGGVASGRLLASGFDMLRPVERYFLNPATLYVRSLDDDFVDRYRRLRNWYRLNKDVAGKLYLEAVEWLFKENRLARGVLEIEGKRVSLANLEMPIELVGGTRDHITPPEQVFALKELAPKAEVRTHLAQAGHIGVFMGTGPLKSVWPDVAKRLKEIE